MKLHNIELGQSRSRACPYCKAISLMFQCEGMCNSDSYRCGACNHFVIHSMGRVGDSIICGLLVQRGRHQQFEPCQVDTRQVELPLGVG
jgi:hypothetical protein